MNDALAKKIDACPGLPTLPTVALEVLELVKSGDGDMSRLAHVVEKDPALAGRVLKMVNSSFYGRSQKVTTVQQALVMLGLQSVRTLVLGFTLVDGLKNNSAAGFDHKLYWRRSFYTACAAKFLAQQQKMMQAEELFICGLLADIGMLALDACVGDEFGKVCGSVTSHADLAAAETRAFGGHHGEVGGYIADKWKLPPVLAEPIRWHVDPTQADDDTLHRMADMVRIAGRCADVYTDAEPAGAIADVRRDLAEVAGDPGTADVLLAKIGDMTRETAALFDFQLGADVRFDRILSNANQALIELTLQTQMQAASLQQQAADREVAFAKREQELKKAATTDGLTGLANRAAFDVFLAEELAQSTGSNAPLALVMIDVDKFKSVNDTHGHSAGDAVLRHIGKMLVGFVGEQDLAARYGGEEMALVLPLVHRARAAALAEELRAALAAKPIPVDEGVSLPITASFGIAAFEPGSPLVRPELLIKAADRALYHAKESGRNRVKVFSLPGNKAA